MALKEDLNTASEYLKTCTNLTPRHAVILGTGLKDITTDFEIIKTIPVADIPGFPVMTVEHMDGRLFLVRHNKEYSWLVAGRLHYYEGHTMEEVTFPIRLLAISGVENFFFTNAAGNVNPKFKAGDMVLIRDHINWSFPSPLIGSNTPEWGPRYPEMIDRYHLPTNQLLLDYASRSGFQLDTGTYLGLTGPQLETQAEYQMFHRLGADMVGMSTIPEVIVAAHMNRRITALSILSNDAASVAHTGATNIEEIIKTIARRKKDVDRLIRHWMSL